MTDSQTPPLPSVPVVESPDAKNSLAAIWSLVFGILSFCLSFFAFLPALILGIIGIVKINGSNGMLKGRGLAVSGIALGGVGLFVSAILASVAMPAYNGILEKGKRIKTIQDVKALTVACQVYAAEQGGKFPSELNALYPDYIDAKNALEATDSKTGEKQQFIYFPRGLMANITKPAELPLIASPFVSRRQKRVVGFCDGHVEEVREEDYQTLLKSSAKPKGRK